MAPQTQRTARQIRLAAELRAIRAERGKTQAEVYETLGWSAARMSRIESGQVKIGPDDLNELLDLYGDIDPGRRVALLELASKAGRRGWSASYSDVFPSAFPTFEEEALGMWVWDPNVVTGLLQTAAYTRALVSAGSARDPQAAERRVEARRLRRAILDRETPPTIEAFVGEPALRWQVGGRDVMREQLLELWDVATRREDITVRVVPFSAGAHFGLDGPLTIFLFEHDAQIGYTETGLGGATYLESATDLEEITLRRESIENAALSPQQSAELIKDIADAI